SYHPRPAPWTAGLQLRRIASKLRRLRLDRLYYLPPLPRTRRQVWRDRLFFQVLCGIQDTRGLHATDAGFGRRDSCGNPVPLPSEILRLLKIVSPEEDIRFDVPIGDAERAAVDRIWRT